MILNQSSNKSTTNTSCTCSRCFPPHSVVTKCVNRRLIKISPLACEPATNKKVSIYWTYVHVHAALHKICIGYIALLSDLLRSGVQRLPHLGYQMDYISKTEPFYVCMNSSSLADPYRTMLPTTTTLPSKQIVLFVHLRRKAHLTILGAHTRF
ncbi:uncharacterized protein LOC100276507 [Zea mays]|uniref:Uncharacterized protein n=1 Tax=Zea mays TaxID=4577 RepID=B6TCV8_MAIZE|nr:uncharacterized protein LOC100276507 [Zea mays]ACG34941.1 hypothetical protein [Zea mays]AQK82426.1 hypothetical protein ZEAMMB73_Zm00001d036932 [Zea mays]|eukprot:NP_001143750.1 uncharacterized protein LOC100276507 [Zea mays]